ncbi:Lnb N-terminal periplasmic domain-containing protein [Myroides sp.]|uniref:Lnb N-terminal periplasmic domain-containing protein n=1 Tax=Myroides sp. TaxID=1874736 RepID=UPI003F357DA2
MTKKIIYLFFCLFIGQMAFSNERPLSDRAEISVITCGVGDQLYSLFGHTAIRVNDPFEGIDRVYNYGMFDFRTPNFYGKFVKGDLLYFADYTTYRNFIASYVYDNRAVYEQPLDLTQAQKEAIWNKLNASLEEENKYYVYKFIDQNCTTKVVDIVNGSISSPVKVDVTGNTSTYRSILNSYLSSRYFEMLGINLIFGSKVDADNTLLFLPDKFMQGLAETQINGKPLVTDTITVFEPEGTIDVPSMSFNSLWFFCVVVLVLAMLMARRSVRSVYFVLLGLLGVFFFGVGFYSLHGELLSNNTVLLCCPIFLVLPFIRKKVKLARGLQVLTLISVILYILLNITSQKLLITLPLVLLTIISLAIEMRLIKGRNS